MVLLEIPALPNPHMTLAMQHHRFANGLTLLAEVNPDAHTAAVGFYVKTGSRDEDPPSMGVSHFLEHMLFKGTRRGRNGQDINRHFDDMGANYNASTGEESTAYYAHVLPEHLPQAVDLLGELFDPALRQEDFELERQVILEEIAMHEDSPVSRLHDAAIEACYGEHPVGFRILGTNQTIQALTPQAMGEYFRRQYAGDHIIVAAAGRLNFDSLRNQVGQLSRDWRPAQTPRPQNHVEQGAGDHCIHDARVNRHYLSMLCPAPDAQDPRRYAALVLSGLLGDSEGSRLYWALVDPGVAEEADFSFEPMDGLGRYWAYACCDPQRAAVMEQTLLATLDGCGEDLQEQEIERVRNKLVTQAMLIGESPMGRMNYLASQWLSLGRYISLEEELSHLLAVGRRDLLELLAAFPFRPRHIIRLGPVQP